MVWEAGQEEVGEIWHEEDAKGQKKQGNSLDTVPASAPNPGALWSVQTLENEVELSYLGASQFIPGFELSLVEVGAL